MPKKLYRVTLQREITTVQEYEITIEAHSEDEAEEMALSVVNNKGFRGQWEDCDGDETSPEVVSTEEA